MTGEPGDDSTRGLIPRAVDLLFSEIATLTGRGWTFKIHTSFLEIYNETIRDLLCEEGTTVAAGSSGSSGHVGGAASASGLAVALAKRHEIKAGKNGHMFVTNLREVEVHTSSDLAALIELAHSNRATSASEMNERSSRSHSVCRVRLEGHHEATGSSCSSTINMVDLAGSERLAVPSQADIDREPLHLRAQLLEDSQKRQAETLAINKSLSTLATVVQAVRLKSSHVPYRDSKLTYVLSDALGGDAKVRSLRHSTCTARHSNCLVSHALAPHALRTRRYTLLRAQF
jgi:kinesin family protein C1